MDATTYGKRSFMCGAAMSRASARLGARRLSQPDASFRPPRSYCDPNPVGSAPLPAGCRCLQWLLGTGSKDDLRSSFRCHRLSKTKNESSTSSSTSNAVFPTRYSNCRNFFSLCCARARAPCYNVRHSPGRPEASTPVITWRKLGENLRCRNGSKGEAHWAKIAS